jgi:2-polyprenyl-3-methyl-5-hydroxy-6-metoxy-1,4-benzoquinol methylase
MYEARMAAEVRMGQLNADFGKTAVDYGKHRAGFPSELFDRLAAMGIGRAGARTLDLGTGTGTIARSLAQRGCDSIGLDRSAPLMEEARRMDREAGVTVRYVEQQQKTRGSRKRASTSLSPASVGFGSIDRVSQVKRGAS